MGEMDNFYGSQEELDEIGNEVSEFICDEEVEEDDAEESEVEDEDTEDEEEPDSEIDDSESVE